METSARELVRQRAGGRCEYCRLPEEVDEWPFHLEHVIAKQHGGSDSTDNLCWSCSRCNFYKGPNVASIDLNTGAIVRLFHPRHDAWKEHFAVRGAHIFGITEVGRATVQLLHMNDHRRLDLRRNLIERDLI